MNEIDVIWLDDDLKDSRWAAKQLAVFKQNHFHIIPCSSVAEAMEQIHKSATRNVLLDVAMPNSPKEGLILLEYIKRSNPELRVVVLTNYPHHEDAVRAIK